MPAHLKILALVGFSVLVIAIPDQRWWWYLIPASVVSIALVWAKVSPRLILQRLLVLTPFWVFALLLPFVATGDEVQWAGLSLSQQGIWAGATLMIRSGLCLLAALALASSVNTADFVFGLQRLRLPEPLVQITSFMLRYTEVVSTDLSHMSKAMRARGFRARNPKHWPILARSLGALFVRTFERGERVHTAMLSRGYSGTFPSALGREASA